MNNLPNVFRFLPRNQGSSCLKDSCGSVKTTKSGGHQPSFSRKWGTAKLNQTDA